MRFLKLEHSKLSYYGDLCLYGATILAWAYFLTVTSPATHYWAMLVSAALGLLSWGPLEYVLHRFVLHGLPPFKTWHAEHHRRPTALICLPLLWSVGLLAVLIFLPALLSGYRWSVSALIWGLLTAYFFYALMHHALHHGAIQAAWLRPYRYWHALHHASDKQWPGRYGVTNRLWDRLFITHR